MPHALLLEDVSKRFAGHLAVAGLSLAIPRGTIYGVLGPNGAGKSTTLRIALGIIGRDSGRVELLGSDPERDRTALRRVGYLPEERGLYRKMRVLDAIVFFGRLKGMPASRARSEGARWLERLGLAEWSRQRVDSLSKGMQQKVQFVSTVVHSPDLLVLDEPTSGLDPVNQGVLIEALLAARDEGKTVLFSTHNMDQAEQLCDSVCIIAGGRKVLDGELREIRRRYRGNRWRIAVEGPSPATEAWVRSHAGFLSVRGRGEGWEVEMAPAADSRGLLEGISRLGEPLTRLERVEPSLHEIFVERVGEAARAPRRNEEALV